MKHLKKLTILHSNDLHGEFFAKEVDDTLVGGVSMLSGYVQKVRQEEENVIYAIAGDMFRGSLIDSEFKGISTIEIMNLIAPDIVTLGNHEVDYGLSHLLFLEKCAKFPIINANMYITMNHTRLFRSHYIKEIDGMKVLFIGILTEEVLHATKRERFIGTLVGIAEAAEEVGRICNAYRTTDIDFTVLLTHIGIEADKELASRLDPSWGVDIIIGGHSHTLLHEPVVVAGIPIVQAACGTDQIGRFDIQVDTDNNCIDHYDWNLIPISDENCPRDKDLESVIYRYKEQTDSKYKRIITRLVDRYTHPVRNQETILGKLLADAFKDLLSVDVMFLGSGSIRREDLGPIVTWQDLLEVMPYNDSVNLLVVDGATLRKMIRHIFREEAFAGHTEFFQYSRGFRIEYDRGSREITSLSLNGYEIQDQEKLKLGVQGYHILNMEDSLGITMEEASKYRKPKVLASSSADVVEEYFSRHELIRASGERRIIVTE